MGGRRKVDAIHAWGVVTMGVGLFAGIPALAAVTSDPGAPLDWWFIPGLVLAGLLVIGGLVLVTVPVVPEVSRKGRPGPAPVPKDLDREGDRVIAAYRAGPSPDRDPNLAAWQAKVDVEARRVLGRRKARALRRGHSEPLDAALRRREWLGTLPGHRALREPPPPDRWLASTPIMVDGQLRTTVKHARTTKDSHLDTWGVHLKVTGPEGTQRLKKPGIGSGYSNGVYIAHYPQDFGGGKVKPGRYKIQWCATDIESSFGDQPARSVPIADVSVVVTPDLCVELAD